MTSPARKDPLPSIITRGLTDRHRTARSPELNYFDLKNPGG